MKETYVKPVTKIDEFKAMDEILTASIGGIEQIPGGIIK